MKNELWLQALKTRLLDGQDFLMTLGQKTRTKLRGYGSIRKEETNISYDAILYSLPKCGRTWLRYIYFLLYGQHLIAEHRLVKRILFSKKIVMIRDIRDMLVSYFFEVTKRGGFGMIDPIKKRGLTRKWNRSEKNISAFIRLGVIDLYADFYERCLRLKGDTWVIKYEELQQEPQMTLEKMCAFLGKPVDSAELINALNQATFEEMRKMERQGEGFPTEKHDGVYLPNLVPAKIDDEESYKTRKGIIGGYAQYLTKEDQDYINQEVKKKYEPVFNQYGYVL